MEKNTLVCFIKYNMLTKQLPRPFCKQCKAMLAKPNGISKHGFQKWHKYCVDCAKAMYNPRFGYLLHKKNRCEKCSFVAVDSCQLEIIYKDNNKKNKDKSNMRTLCTNCAKLHRKKLKEKKKSILNITVDADVTI